MRPNAATAPSPPYQLSDSRGMALGPAAWGDL